MTAQRRLIAHLLRRSGFGATQQEIDIACENGYDATVQSVLNPGESNHIPDDVIQRYHSDMHELRYGDSSAAYWLYRMISTQTPMVEKIALFWHGIFATGYSKLNNARSVLNQVDMFRNFGLGKFDNLLLELSKDPAMIIWLDNHDNHNGSINENFGRELLELFSMGIGNYSENDIKEASRAFTGWTLGNVEYMAMRASKDSIWPYGRIAWHFNYDKSDHDNGRKTFLENTGNFNGEDIVKIICNQESTARFISRHLYDFFVADEEPVPQWNYTEPNNPEAIDELVQIYFDSDHNISAMLEAIFYSDYFTQSEFSRVKCPAEIVAGTLRMSGSIQSPSDKIFSSGNITGYMGQMLLNPPSVEGWHEGTEWINSGALVERVNFASAEIGDITNPGIRSLVSRVVESLQVDEPNFSSEELINTCTDFLGVAPMGDSIKQTLINLLDSQGDFAQDNPSELENRIVYLLSLISSTPEFQLT